MTGLFVFTDDLRLDDNPLLNKAAAECDALVLAYCLPSSLNALNHYGLKSISPARLQFLKESYDDLNTELSFMSQQVILKVGDVTNSIQSLIEQHGVNRVYIGQQQGTYERKWLQDLSDAGVTLITHDQNLLYQNESLTKLAAFKQFTPFRHWVEKELFVRKPVDRVFDLPPLPSGDMASSDLWPNWFDNDKSAFPFQGGELSGITHLINYLEVEGGIRTYKKTRNHLGQYEDSSMLSAWLSVGNISPRTVWYEIEKHESQHGKNDSTYWLKFELLWREFFHWQLRRHGDAFFSFSGIRGKRPQQSFYPQFFQAWCHGNTGEPLVDACMRELKQTGFLSNRGRQIAASYLVNDLGVDWRFGAAWFESLLVDYDVAANWGNWMYIAGVGHDSRNNRYFNIQKQAKSYDPDARYVSKWIPDLRLLPIDQRHAPYKHSDRFPVPLKDDLDGQYYG